MGLLSKVFGSGNSEGDTFTCDSCGEEADRSSVDNIWDLCNDCYNAGGGTNYCCGMIYEDGETTCRSCGDPL
jgi:hypothetical protein